MKGAIFTCLQELVEQEHGLVFWDKVITERSFDSDGIYISTKNYSDEELFSIVTYLAEATKTSTSQLIQALGKKLFLKLLPMAPPQAQQASELRTFLLMVDKIIHVEVLKLYADANLPEFKYDNEQSDYLIMKYTSPRKLCHLSEGLILGASAHFNQKVSIQQTTCMHSSDDCCTLKIRFL